MSVRGSGSGCAKGGLGYRGCGAWLSCGKRDFETDSVWRQIAALDNKVLPALQLEMFASVAEFLEQALTSVLRSYKDCLDMGVLKTRFHAGVTEVVGAMPRPLAAQDKAGSSAGCAI